MKNKESTNNNPYKKMYTTTKIDSYTNSKKNKKDIIKLNKELRDIEQEQNNIYNKKTNNKKNQFKCNKCKISYNNPVSLEKHKPIHLKPVYCSFLNCKKIFSPKHKYQYKQHIDSHNGGLHIKCKFCAHQSKTLTSNTVHMKKEHIEKYTHYMKEISNANLDIQPLNSKKIINLTTKYINTNIMDDLNDNDSIMTNNISSINWYSNKDYGDDDDDCDIDNDDNVNDDDVNNDNAYNDDDDYDDDNIDYDYYYKLINKEKLKYDYMYYKNNLELLAYVALYK